ncbi:metal-dependent hydrolase [Nesterenkonia rhizosphaerae]
MGAHHAASGAAAWVVIASDYEIPTGELGNAYSWMPEALPIGLGLIDAGHTGVLVGAIVCAGGAMLADADHHNASIAHSLPPVSRWICNGIGTISGGHRNGTHSILGVAVFALIAWALSLLVFDINGVSLHVGAGVFSILLASFAIKVLKFLPASARRSHWAVAVPIGAMVTLLAPDQNAWFLWAVAIGVTIHILGDMLTTGGVNWLWPLTIKPPASVQKTPVLNRMWMRNGRQALPILGNTGSVAEWALSIPISIIAVVGMCLAITGAASEGWAMLLAA